jgi:hypothetical protein
VVRLGLYRRRAVVVVVIAVARTVTCVISVSVVGSAVVVVSVVSVWRVVVSVAVAVVVITKVVVSVVVGNVSVSVSIAVSVTVADWVTAAAKAGVRTKRWAGHADVLSSVRVTTSVTVRVSVAVSYRWWDRSAYTEMGRPKKKKRHYLLPCWSSSSARSRWGYRRDTLPTRLVRGRSARAQCVYAHIGLSSSSQRLSQDRPA